MKNLLILLFCLVLLSAFTFSATNPIDKKECTYNGIPLWGEVKVSDHKNLADFKIKIDNAFPDIVVNFDNIPQKCGEWRLVTYGEDFSVYFVTAFQDFSISISDSFPGVR